MRLESDSKTTKYSWGGAFAGSLVESKESRARGHVSVGSTGTPLPGNTSPVSVGAADWSDGPPADVVGEDAVDCVGGLNLAWRRSICVVGSLVPSAAGVKRTRVTTVPDRLCWAYAFHGASGAKASAVGVRVNGALPPVPVAEIEVTERSLPEGVTARSVRDSNNSTESPRSLWSGRGIKLLLH